MVARRVSKAQEVLDTAFGNGCLVTPSKGDAGGGKRSRDIVQAALVGLLNAGREENRYVPAIRPTEKLCWKSDWTLSKVINPDGKILAFCSLFFAETNQRSNAARTWNAPLWK